MIFSYRAPVPAREEVFIVSWLPVNVVREHRDHVFVSLGCGQYIDYKQF